MTQRPQHGDVGFVLDVDPDLGSQIPAAELPLVREAARGRLISLRPGRCDLARLMSDGRHILGFLIAEGMACSEIKLRDRYLIELAGPGDILQPVREDDGPGLVSDPTITILTDALLVALGPTFIQAAARWPDLLTAALIRIERQRRRLATQSLIVHLPQAKHRLLLILWHLSGRWGRVTPDGIHVPLRLTHDVLGQLIAARRPTVTLAIKELEGEGCLRRRDDGSWLLTSTGQETVKLISAPYGTRSMGDALLLHQRTTELVRHGQALRREIRHPQTGAHRSS